MRMTRSVAGLLLSALVTLMVFGAGAAGAAQGQTISDFAVKVYKGALSRQQAVAALRGVAPSIQNPDARLTEGTLAEIMTGFGIKSTSRQPDFLMDQGRADAALLFIWQSSLFPGGQAGASSGAGGGPIDLASCIGDRNIWTCMQCCLSLGGPAGSCGRSCTFGVSPSGP